MRLNYSKKIEISISQYHNKSITNEFINNYDNLDELLQLCALSSYVPILSGLNLPSIGILNCFTAPSSATAQIESSDCFS